MSTKIKQTVREWALIIVVGFILALVIQQTAFAVYIVEGDSMLPTLHSHERVFVNRLPLYFGHIDRGDIVIFPNPVDGRNFVKRVIGIAGDSVEIREGVVYLNDEILHETYIDSMTYGEIARTIVDDGHVFVMGDNRYPGGSWDSRDPRIGQIPLRALKGKANFVLFPFPHGVK